MHTQLCRDDECYSLIVQVVISEAKYVGRLRLFHLIIYVAPPWCRIYAPWSGVRGRISLMGELTSKEPLQGKTSATSNRD